MYSEFKHDFINTFIEEQLSNWPLARQNYNRFTEVKRRIIRLGDLETALQFNPSRIVSTGAKIDRKTIETRPCFLCAHNRPKEQISIPFDKDWEFLLNPYPILPIHFTIANRTHRPQGLIPLEMASMAEHYPGLTIFYNGAQAGASAPDHQHAQAVLTSELPLMRLVENVHDSVLMDLKSSESFGLDLPFQFISAILPPTEESLKVMMKIPFIFGVDAKSGQNSHSLVNAYFWIDHNGLLRIVLVPRRRHRPLCYSYQYEDGFLISPGAIDMAGLMISPRQEDFERIDEAKMREIYRDVAFEHHLPSSLMEYLNL